jgi:phosphopantetheinyl transferase
MSAEQIFQLYMPFELQGDVADSVELPWLTGIRERSEYRRLTCRARQEAWKLGRILGRRLLKECTGYPDSSEDQVEILSRNSEDKSDRPSVFINGRPFPVSLSISHSDRGVLVVASETMQVGVDLVDRRRLPGDSLWFWFTSAEKQWMSQTDSLQQATVWAVKEAVYKAVNEGDAFAPGRISVFPQGQNRYSCSYGNRNLFRNCVIHTSELDDHIVALAEYKKNLGTEREIPGARTLVDQHPL